MGSQPPESIRRIENPGWREQLDSRRPWRGSDTSSAAEDSFQVLQHHAEALKEEFATLTSRRRAFKSRGAFGGRDLLSHASTN